MNVFRTIALATSALAIAGAAGLASAQVDPANPNSSTASPPNGAPMAKPYTRSERQMRRDRERSNMGTGAMGSGTMGNSTTGATSTDGTMSTDPSKTTTAPGSTNGAYIAPGRNNTTGASGASLDNSGTERVARADRN